MIALEETLWLLEIDVSELIMECAKKTPQKAGFSHVLTP